MNSRTQSLELVDYLDHPSPLRAVLPDAPFQERHGCAVDADPERVWALLHTMRWSDLRLTRLLMLVRAGFRPGLASGGVLDPGSPGHPVAARAPEVLVSAMIGRPWANERGRDVTDLAGLAAYDEPGWLRYGMEFRLTALPGGRTYVETSTVCAATDAASERRFRAYWTLIRPFSGMIRADLLRTLQRMARQPTSSAGTAPPGGGEVTGS